MLSLADQRRLTANEKKIGALVASCPADHLVLVRPDYGRLVAFDVFAAVVGPAVLELVRMRAEQLGAAFGPLESGRWVVRLGDDGSVDVQRTIGT